MNDSPLRDDWTPCLASAIAAAVREFAPRLKGEPIALLAVDCHPWHGRLGLAALTASEAVGSLLSDPAEMAAWQYFDFTRDMQSWRSVAELGRQMRTAYESGNRPAVAEAFLRACASAVQSQVVTVSLNFLNRSTAFRLSVTHPDDGREFVPSGSGM